MTAGSMGSAERNKERGGLLQIRYRTLRAIYGSPVSATRGRWCGRLWVSSGEIEIRLDKADMVLREMSERKVQSRDLLYSARFEDTEQL